MNQKWIRTIVWMGTLFFVPAASTAAEPSAAAPQPTLEGPLTLGRVVRQVLLHNPALQAFSLETRAREAEALQAGLLPNPRLNVEVENVAGSGAFRGFESNETTIQLSQLIELGGKRAARAQAASLSRELAAWDYETARMDVLTRTSKAFTAVLSAQERARLARELVELAQTTLTTIEERVEAGKVSPIQKTRARIAFSDTRLILNQANNELAAARQRLAATWGSFEPAFDSVQGDLYFIRPLPPYSALTRQLDRNPDLARWSTEILQRQAALESEEAQAVPDLTLHGGYRRLEETGDNAAVFGITVPLQLFDRNQGDISAARHRLAQTEQQKRTAEIRVHAALSDAYSALATARGEALTLKQKILPEARKAFEAINEGYRFGKFGFLDVLDSQRTLFEARARYLKTLARYHQAVAEVERLTGEPLSTVSDSEPPGKGGPQP